MNLRERFYESKSRRVKESERKRLFSPILRLFVSPAPRLLFALFLLAAAPAAAQPANQDPVPRNERAEVVFAQGLQAFEAADYPTAYLRFREAYEQYPLHRKTTAATLMAGKALYRNGEYESAVALLTAFLQDYPRSGYREAAGRTLGFAQQKVREEQRRNEALRLGIALPMNRNDTPLTQELFNGIRLAVEEHNRTAQRPVQMIFRDTKNTPLGARQAVMALVDERVDVIIGPLYSGEAQAAAGTAEREGVVLVAPLATDEDVARGRRYVFQANPTITLRGAVMARFAFNDLRLRTVGVVAESGNSISERMAEGFQEEARRLGADVVFFQFLSGSRDWAHLSDLIGQEMMAQIDAIYLPLHRDFDRDAYRLIQETLNDLDRLASPPRVLGGSKWHDVPFKSQASAFGVTYTDVFYVDASLPDVQTFQRRYRNLAGGQQPDRLAYVGFDVTQYLIRHLVQQTGEALPEALRDADLYQGLGTRIHFNDDNANEALFLLHYRNAEIELLR
jgi:branched-chain amino acid transport system substrate-binding protein